MMWNTSYYAHIWSQALQTGTQSSENLCTDFKWVSLITVNISIVNVSNKQSCVADNLDSRKEIVTDKGNCNQTMYARK